jgi:hypothetical protein
MTPSRVTAALGLLRKVLPDQAAVVNTHQGTGGGPIVISSTDAEL